MKAAKRLLAIAARAVVDDEVDLDFVFYGLVYDSCSVFVHFRIRYAGDHFVEREGFMSQEQT
jgi:hypothetical protein